jgi:hypothetical protein
LIKKEKKQIEALEEAIKRYISTGKVVGKEPRKKVKAVKIVHHEP